MPNRPGPATRADAVPTAGSVPLTVMPASRPSRARRALPIVLLAIGLPLAACADFSSETPTFTVQPSLTARAAVPDEPTPGAPPSTAQPTDSGAPPTSGSAPATDPCAPTDDAVIATCLSAPWGLAPLPDGIEFQPRVSNSTDIVHFFTASKVELAKNLLAWLKVLAPDAVIWVSWPKKSSKMPSDVTEDTIRAVALPMGLVDIKVCAVDDTWSGLKLVLRKAARPR